MTRYGAQFDMLAFAVLLFASHFLGLAAFFPSEGGICNVCNTQSQSCGAGTSSIRTPVSSEIVDFSALV